MKLRIRKIILRNGQKEFVVEEREDFSMIHFYKILLYPVWMIIAQEFPKINPWMLLENNIQSFEWAEMYCKNIIEMETKRKMIEKEEEKKKKGEIIRKYQVIKKYKI